jgi:hypothetical protein
MERSNNEPAEGVESGGPLSKLGDFVLPTSLDELPVCVNVRPPPRSDGYNHAVMVATTAIRKMVDEEVGRSLQNFLNGLVENATYVNTSPTQDPHGLPGIQSHQIIRPIYDPTIKTAPTTDTPYLLSSLFGSAYRRLLHYLRKASI